MLLLPKAVWVGLLAGILLPACHHTEVNDRVLAKVNGKELTEKEVRLLMGNREQGYGTDSVSVARGIITKWALEQLLLDLADEQNAPQEPKSQFFIDEYKRELGLYKLEQKIIREQLDTVVSPSEIKLYYLNHQRNFQLPKNVVRLNYVRAPKGAPKWKMVQQWFYSGRPTDRIKLMAWCERYADNYFMNDNAWLYFDDLLKEIPIKEYDQEFFLQNNRFLQLSDQSSNYLVNILDFRLKNAVSPLEYERDRIKKLILHEKSTAIIRNFERLKLKEAEESGQIEYFQP